ncbi:MULTISPECIES: hypothetical protein [unclassified Sphingomonas]|uniref:hypothetical protein n=1 Tax=unclassified Sphingomonas TaxID=196159 RepID=UPI00215107E0|nr:MULTISPECIES: hypothetical protein [unclassified Sphingomonas]MCR5870659.1 hypothetical protein [Sphingomonas sp. J344]UUY01003.1 hypothetical protein LRS08_08090 [Sphingomonas sp. J315]
MLDTELREHDASLITVTPTGEAADANLLPISHEPVGAKRQARDLKPLVWAGKLTPAPDAAAVADSVMLFADDIRAVGIDRDEVAYILLGDPLAPDTAGVWITTRDQEVGDAAVFTRII